MNVVTVLTSIELTVISDALDEQRRTVNNLLAEHILSGTANEDNNVYQDLHQLLNAIDNVRIHVRTLLGSLSEEPEQPLL